MPKMLLVTTVATTLEAFLLPNAAHFRDLGWQVDAAARGVVDSAACGAAFDQVWEIPWSRRIWDPRNLLTAPHTLAAIVSSQQYDLVHFHTPVAAFAGRLAVRRLHRRGLPRVLYTAHGFHFYEGGSAARNALFLKAEQIAGRWTDYLIVINQEDLAAARRHRIVAQEHTFYMPGIGIDTQQYAAETVTSAEVDRVRAELGLRQGEPLLLMIAEFNRGKRHEDAIRALARCRSRHAHLALAGVGPLLEPMRQLAVQLGVAERTHFLGFRRDVPTLIRASVATILPSEREGLPRSVMESLAMGVPVIGADTRGIRDLIQEGCGLIFPVGDVGALANAVDTLLTSPEAALAMGRCGRAQMDAYDIRRILEAHEQLYQLALDSDKQGA